MDGRALPRAARGYPLAGALTVALLFGGLASAQTTTKPRVAGPALPAAVVTTRPATFRVVTTKAAKKKVTTTTKRKSRITVKTTTIPEAVVDTLTPATLAPAPSGPPDFGPMQPPPAAISYSTPVIFVPGAGKVLELAADQVGQLVAGGRVDVDIRGSAGLAASGTGSVVLDVTVTNPGAPGTVTVSPLVPDDQQPIQTAVVTYGAGPTLKARISVPIGSQGLVHVDMTGGAQGLAFDVVGWVAKATGAPNNDGGTPLTPCRLIDTAANVGGIQGPTPTPFDLPAVAVAQIPGIGAAGTQPVSILFGVFGANAAASSTLNFVQTGQTTPAMTLVMTPGSATNGLFLMPIGANNRLTVYPKGATMNIAVDAVGWLDKDGQGHSGGPCP